jgi:hypothetical protein
METRDTCLYIHTRKSDGGIFYVGIGDSKRPYDKRNRNKYWYNVVKKHDYDVVILKTNMTWKEACDLEIIMIAFYGRIKPSKKNLNYGCLVNMTDGGDGTKGLIMSEENKKIISERMKTKTGKNNYRFGKTHNEETKKKMSENMNGKNNHRFGKKASEETKKKMSEKRKGEKHPNSKKVICNITNKIYNCIKDAAEDIGVNINTLRGYLCGDRPNKTSIRYL